jgi:PAT family acetyl-CoA transporter-like MFS transporter 1
MSKADIATFSPVLMIIGLVLPAVASPIIAKHPLDVFLRGVLLKITTSLLLLLVSFVVKGFYANGAAELAWYVYVPLFAVMILHEIAGTLTFVSRISFYARISDPAIGGTYMTLLNTISNLGAMWMSTATLWLLPKLTQTVCRSDDGDDIHILNTDRYCHMQDDPSNCGALGGKCFITLDGYTVQTCAGVIIGLLWYLSLKETVLKLQALPHDDWLITTNSNKAIAKSA